MFLSLPSCHKIMWNVLGYIWKWKTMTCILLFCSKNKTVNQIVPKVQSVQWFLLKIASSEIILQWEALNGHPKAIQEDLENQQILWVMAKVKVKVKALWALTRVRMNELLIKCLVSHVQNPRMLIHEQNPRQSLVRFIPTFKAQPSKS